MKKNKQHAVDLKLPPRLVPVFSGDARYRGAYGGRGSGKTRNFAKMTAVFGYKWAMSGQDGQILCGREFMNSLAESSFIEVASAIKSEDWLSDFYDIGTNYIRSKCGRIKYVFAGLRHNIDSIKSKGKLLLCWVDEAENVSDAAWSKLLPTVREDNSEVWVTWNPESPDSPTNIRFRENAPEGSKIIEMNYCDNPWFPSVLELERKEDQRKRPETYDWIWLGKYNNTHHGAIFAQELSEAKDDGRIGVVPYKAGVPVITAWDLGRSDSTAIWFAQRIGLETRIIDYYENRMQALDHYADLIRSKSYSYGGHYLPHDGRHERLGMDGSIRDQLKKMGISCEVLPQATIESGINLGRALIKESWFDDAKCKEGLAALRRYKYEYDEVRKVFSKQPLHDWTSHPADAFRYLAMAFQKYHPDQPAQEENREVSYGAGAWMG
jgi:phage terminase large subunit